MSFVSPEFAFAALLFFPLYWSLASKRNWQMLFLTVAGYCFYATWSLQFAWILLIFSSYVWLAGRWISSSAKYARNKYLFSIILLLTLALLLYTKYYEFTRAEITTALAHMGLHVMLPMIDIVAPAGISFFTFQAISYLAWQYKSQPPRTSFIHLLLFLSFWPTLFSGPIFRAQDFFTQLAGSQVGRPKQTDLAIYLILLGLLEKMVFSSWLGSTFVDDAFKYPDVQNFTTGLAAILGYSLQIFMDFAGYTLIVTGLGLLLGFTLPINFKQPYLAINLQDFWRRWHISLSTFIRDYVYIPLGGNRQGYTRTQINIFIAMVLSGLWHGANTTFLIWGVLHGLGVIAVNLYDSLFGKSMPSWLSRILTLLYVGLAWVFFRANSNEGALELLRALGSGWGQVTANQVYLLLFTAVFFVCSHYAAAIQETMTSHIRNCSFKRLTTEVSVAICLIILLGPSGVPGFIYYRF